jgi:hypothetical protein
MSKEENQDKKTQASLSSSFKTLNRNKINYFQNEGKFYQ